MAADCDARMAVLDGAAELDRWRTALDRLPGIKKVIVRDPSACPADDRYMTWDDLLALGQERLAAEPGEIEARMAAITPDDPLALLYTSGTTGNPKGVLLTHRNILYTLATVDAWGQSAHGVRWVSYLPLAHIAERMFSVYLPVHNAGHVHFCPDTARLVSVIGKIRPTGFFGVPRVWEKIKSGIQALMMAEQDEGRRAAVQRAMESRPPLRGQLPVRARHVAGTGGGVQRGRRAGARTDPWPARLRRGQPRSPAARPRCPRRWPPSSAGLA